MLKTVSVMIRPPIRKAASMPMIVVTGRNAFFSACFVLALMAIAFLFQITGVAFAPFFDVEKLAAALKPAVYLKNDCFIRQGDIGDTFFVIEAGECLITETKAGEAKERNIVTLYATAWFGERALVKEEPRVANVKAKVDGTKLLFMDKATFKEFLALDEAFLHVVTAITKKTEEIRAKRAQVKVQKEATHRTVDVKKLEERTRETTAVTTITKSQINNYRVVKVLGKGSYGTVKLVEDTKSRRRQRYAMKILKRSALARQKLSAGGGGGDGEDLNTVFGRHI